MSGIGLSLSRAFGIIQHFAAYPGKIVPAGITRFIIPGRVMRINASFEYLKSDRDLDEKNNWLYDLAMERLAKDEVRYYAEPIYLMDE